MQSDKYVINLGKDDKEILDEKFLGENKNSL